MTPNTEVLQCCPQNGIEHYIKREQLRWSGHLVGGVCVLFRSSFAIDRRNFGLNHLSSAFIFNYAVDQFHLRYVLVIYRPPSSSRNSQPFAIFLTEFRDLVERVVMETGIIILGNFDVAYGDNNNAHARALHNILSDANLRQNVTNATHQQGNVFDLVISASSSSRRRPSTLIEVTKNLGWECL